MIFLLIFSILTLEYKISLSFGSYKVMYILYMTVTLLCLTMFDDSFTEDLKFYFPSGKNIYNWSL